jgi:hypothetical protein
MYPRQDELRLASVCLKVLTLCPVFSLCSGPGTLRHVDSLSGGFASKHLGSTKAGRVQAALLPSFEHGPTTLAVCGALIAKNYLASLSARSPTTKRRSTYPHKGRVLSTVPTSTSLCSSHPYPHYATRAILVRPGRAKKGTDNATITEK